MVERFSASAAFTNMNNNNNNSADGWGDDWGDWNETPSGGSTMVAENGPPKSIPSKQLAPVAPANSSATNQYFQQQPPPQPMHSVPSGQSFFDGPPGADQHNHNYLPNQSAPHGYPVATGNVGYQQMQPPPMVPQQQMYPNVAPQQSYAPPAPSYGQANSFFNSTPTPPTQQQQPNRPPSHPPASTTPQLIPTFSQTISDSFDTTASNSWNWNVADTPRSAESTMRDTMPSKQPPQVQTYEDPQQTKMYMAAAPLPNAQLQRVKQETVSPQWSIESQVSSNDRTPESESNPEERPPRNAVPSDENRSGVAPYPSQVPPATVDNHQQAFASYQSYHPAPASVGPVHTQTSVPDRLDEVLEALSVKQESIEPEHRSANVEASYREQSFPPPPPSIAAPAGGPVVNEALNHANKSSSTTPPLPPPPVDSGNIPRSVTKGAGPPPKALHSAGTSANPFKRVGGRSHIATPGLSMAPPAAPSVPPATVSSGSGAYFYQQQQPQQQTQLPTLLQPPPPATIPVGEEANNVETLTPENQEILIESRTAEQGENHEPAPSNDRNQYLQTGHLSEDGYGAEVTANSTARAHPISMVPAPVVGSGAGSNDRRLPPPGLSRYVPGQNQQQPDTGAQPTGQSFPEPPPGLDRMVPGMDLHENASSNLSLLERQADGEVSDSTPAPPSSVVQPSASVAASSGHASQHYLHGHHHHHHHHERVDMSDRNLYRVPGESDNHHHNQQRVVPGGLENDRGAPVAPVPPHTTVPAATPPVGSSSSGVLGPASAAATLDMMPEEQRELVMDGENPDDRREEPLVGGNPEPVASAAPPPGPAVETDSNVTTIDTSRNVEPSVNTSTADESDKGGFYGAGAGPKGGRREDDSLRRSNKSKSSRDRYDTEDSDYSEHERRRRERESSLGATAGPSGGGATGTTGTLADPGNHRNERLRHRTAAGGEREKERRKEGGRDRDRDPRDRDYDYRDRDRTRYDRDRERYGRGSKYDRDSRYETDGSKYETERSTRYEKDDKRYNSSARDDYYRKRDDRAPGDDGRAAGRDRDRDRDGNDRRQRKEKDRSDRYRGDDRRKDDRYREGEKRRDRHDRRYEPEDYRTGSRNGTERDRGARDSRERDDRKEKSSDRKYMTAAGYGAVPGAVGGAAGGGAYAPAGGYYDPYSYYAQHQQYYEQLRRTNPQAYAEWYRNYYSQMQANQLQRDLMTTDGRESVHSGRSSANDKERFNRTTPFMHPPGLYNPEEYHRHYNNQSMPSGAVGVGVGVGGGGLDQSYLSDVSGQPSSLPPMFHHAQAFQHQQQAHSLLHQQQQQQQQHHQQQLRATTSLALNRSYHHGDAGGYFQPRMMDQIDASIAKVDTGTELSMMEPERLTPRKFPEIHPIVSLSAGLLISTKNRLTMNGMADTVKIFSMGYSDAGRKLLQAYPGPLVKGVTHKKSVIEFCEEQLRQGPPYSGALALIKSRGNSINSLHSSSLAAGVNRSSHALLWNYIILLLRQNGTFVGTDISELLMQNKTEYPFETLQTSAIRSANISGRNSSLSLAAIERNPREADARQDGESDREANDEHDSKEAVDAVTSKAPCLSELEITDKFRDYLLYGNIGEALEWATEHNLWGHALFLASKVDSRQHANVMMKFANKLTLNDPLQTLYQLLSGRTPASVTSVLDEKWGDWRPHLAMLMSNSSAKPELIKKSITTLGDTLFNRGDLYAAHFCYLLSDVAFGRFADVNPDAGSNASAVRLVLLGAAHHQRNFRELSTNESIMMTEIYEYARSLNEERYSITELQRYKYLLACRMLDQGLQLKCLLYMEQIADRIQEDTYRFDAEFIRKVYTLGDRLKYYDPVMEKALDESVDNTGRGNIYANVEDPQWLKRLNEILASNQSHGASSYNNSGNGNSQFAYDYNSYGHGLDGHAQSIGQEQPTVPVYPPADTNDINKQFSEISQQLGQLNLQYTTDQPQQQQQQNPYVPASSSEGTVSHQQQQPYESAPVPSYDQGYESINQQHSLLDPTIDQATLHQQRPQDISSYDQSQHQQQYNQYNAYDQQQQQQQQQPQSIGGTNIFTPADNEPAPPGPYDGAYWGAAPGNSEVAKPTISMPNSGSTRSGFNDEMDDDQRTNAAANGGMKPSQSNAAQTKKAAAGKDAKQPAAGGSSGAAQGSGWFGGIWNKFSLKPKNQMILPDDKNPKIVWDEASKRWVNTDEGEAETEAYKPPPKMSDLMPKVAAPPAAPSPAGPTPSGGVPLMPAPNQSADTYPHNPVPMMGGAGIGGASGPQTNAPIGEPTKVPTLQSNMYKMQRNRTLKRSYVDVFNPSGAAPSRPTEPVLAPAVPSMPNPQGGFFVPPGTPSVGQQSNDAAAAGMPQFYNPNEFVGGASGGYQQ